MPKKSKKVLTGKEAERVMVVLREDLFEGDVWNGIRAEDPKKYLKTITTKHNFLPRGEVEQDPRYKQIIPYLIFENGGKIFVMKRKGTHTDKRLANKVSIGVGGHINKRDIKTNNPEDWARREFEEEIEYSGKLKTEFLGILNHDANDVGLVHLGLIFKVVGDSDQIKIRDEHKEGKLMSIAELGKQYKAMETWTQIVYDHLMEKNKKPVKSKNLSLNNIHGILPDHLIAEYIQKGIITISPMPKNWRDSIDQVSMDFHLGGNLKLFKGGTYRFIDTRRGLPDDAMEEINLKDGDPFILEPGAFAIASTSELLKLPNDILGRLEGKSSLARLGILVHSTAARFDPGWNGAPVLELGNLGPKPAILYCGMPICAFTFEKLAAPVRMKYEGSRSDRYSGSRLAVASKIDSALDSNALRPSLRKTAGLKASKKLSFSTNGKR